MVAFRKKTQVELCVCPLRPEVKQNIYRIEKEIFLLLAQNCKQESKKENQTPKNKQQTKKPAIKTNKQNQSKDLVRYF